MPTSDAQQRFERVYPVSAATLFEAFQAAVSGGPYKKPEVDSFTRAIAFQSKRSAFSWGHHWQGQVLDDPSGAKLSLTAAVTIASSQGSGSGKRASEVATKLFAEVSSRAAAAGQGD